MKFKFRLFTLFVMFLARQSTAQTFRAGLNTGLVATELNGATPSGHFHKVGTSLGLLVNNSGGEKKTDIFQLELNFIQKGTFFRGYDSIGTGRFKIALSYVEIPVLVRHKIHFTKRGKQVNRVDLEAGASYGRMIAYYTVNQQNSILHQSNNLLNYNDISILFGFDINITAKFIINFRYSNSIIPAIKRNTPNVQFLTYTFNRGNNEVMLFSLKFMFGANPDENANKVPEQKPDGQEQ